MIVDSIMRRDVPTIDVSASVRAAAKRMTELGSGCLVVTRGDDVVGIVTERDVVRRVVAADRDPDHTRAADVASAPVLSVAPDASIEHAASEMKRRRVKRLVVVRDGTVVGLLSVTDIAYGEPDLVRGLLDAWVKPRVED